MAELSSPDASPRSTNSSSPSSEFEFRSLPYPDLPSADELFSHGILLPLNQHQPPFPPPTIPPSEPTTIPTHISSDLPHHSSSRWKDFFKKQPGDRKLSPELNINLWPFSRSRSAGNRQRAPAVPQRKVSSAPCSRSNSRGRWASSPGRPPGVHVGRASPVWRRVPKNGGEIKGGTLNRKANTCIGCGGERKDNVTGGERNARVAYFGLKELFFSSKKVY